jgi:hypothetical protein
VLGVDAKIGHELRRLFSAMSDYNIGDHDYVAYFVNEHGEQKRPGAEEASCGVPAFRPGLGAEARGGTSDERGEGSGTLPRSTAVSGDVPVVGDVILNHHEAPWLKACLAASERW